MPLRLGQLLEEPSIAVAQRRARSSIDGYRPDGALVWTERTFPGSPLHLTTAEAVANVEPVAASRPRTVLVGHGAPGVISTGCGSEFTSSTNDNQMNVGNAWAWDQLLQHLRGRTNLLMLVACGAGRGGEGHDFLWQIACAIEATAAAPTNNLYAGPTGRIWAHWRTRWHYMECDETSRFRRAGMLSQVRRRLLSRLSRSANSADLTGGAALGAVPLMRIVGVRYTSIGDPEDVSAFEGVEATELLRHVDPTPEVVGNGNPLSFPTGHLEILEAAPEGDREHHFTVYGGYLLRDERRPDLFYEADETFTEMLGGWKRVIGSLLPERGERQTPRDVES